MTCDERPIPPAYPGLDLDEDIREMDEPRARVLVEREHQWAAFRNGLYRCERCERVAVRPHTVTGPCPGAPAADPINRPRHYTAGKIEPIDVIEDWHLGFHLGNAVKYIARHLHKGAALDDMRKAQWYVNRYVEWLERRQIK
jgi:hypothetical protein